MEKLTGATSVEGFEDVPILKLWHTRNIMFYVMFQHWDTTGMLSLMFKHLASRKQTEQSKQKTET